MSIINAVILAAGKGNRMHSSKPKVLQVLAGKTLLQHILDKAYKVCEKVFVVYGFGGQTVPKFINDERIHWIKQTEQLGTGDAVARAVPSLDAGSITLVLYGDVPLIKTTTLQGLIKNAEQTGFALLSVVLDDPTGYGRIIRDKNNQIKAVIEQQDGNQTQLKINEVHTGIIAVKTDLLKTYVAKLKRNNAQNELYLTDIIALAAADGVRIAALSSDDKFEAAGVNDKAQLATLERVFQQNQATAFMQQGLGIKDPNRFDCRGVLSFGQDCILDVNVLIEGEVSLGNNTIIGANCSLKNVRIGNNVTVLQNCVIEGAHIDEGARIGPFARIRPQTQLGKNVKIGNFVEVKQSNIGKNSKISHLSYIGDSIIYENVNIGAGVITCNYDGVNKNQTIIKNGAFIGSNSQLIAPVTIGKNAIIGAGSTISKDAPDAQLTLSRAKQISLKNWRK